MTLSRAHEGICWIAPIALAKLRYALGSAVLHSETLESSPRLFRKTGTEGEYPFSRNACCNNRSFHSFGVAHDDDGTRCNWRGRLNSKPQKTTCSDRLILQEEHSPHKSNLADDKPSMFPKKKLVDKTDENCKHHQTSECSSNEDNLSSDPVVVERE